MEACQTCVAHCCTAANKGEGVAFITLRDAQRVAKETGKKIEEFASIYEFESDGELEEYKHSKNPGDRMFASLAYEKQLLSLNTKQNSNTCTFLTRNKMCSIYSARPMICRMFPLWFYKKNGKIVLTKHNYGDPEDEACPVLNEDPDEKELFGLVGVNKKTYDMVEQYYKEMMEYKKYNKLLDEMDPSDVLKTLPKKVGKSDTIFSS